MTELPTESQEDEYEIDESYLIFMAEKAGYSDEEIEKMFGVDAVKQIPSNSNPFISIYSIEDVPY